MRIALDTQLELFDAHATDALAAAIDELRARGPELIALARQRAFDTVGVHEYGDSTYWLSNERLAEEADAELADAIFYLQIAVARAAGALPASDSATAESRD